MMLHVLLICTMCLEKAMIGRVGMNLSEYDPNVIGVCQTLER